MFAHKNTTAQKKKHKLFVPGQRIVRTVAAVMICLIVYELRGRRGMPIFALIAAVMCIQPYTRSMKAIAQRRVIGTLIGAGWGVITLLLEQAIRGIPDPDNILHYLIAAIGCGIVIYFTVWLNLAEMAQFAGIVFLIVVITQTVSGNVFVYAYHRIVDTLIGLVVGEVVNRLHLPRVRNTDILFASGVTNTIFEEGHKISGYSLIELNRLIEDGCKFTVDTIESPASVHELLRDVDFRLPIIGMDGAILFDMKSRTYLEAVMMEAKIAQEIRRLLEEEEVEFFMTTLEHDVLIYRYGEMKNEAIRDVFERKRVSPDRNFAPRLSDVSYMDKTIYFFILDKTEKADRAADTIRQMPWADKIRIHVDERHVPDGYRCIRIFPAEATKERMLAKLQEMVGAKETVTFGSYQGRYDVYIENANKDLMVKELKHRFEPVSLAGWRNIFSADNF